MDTPLVIIVASLAMVVQDVVGTIMVQAEAANRGWLAGWCDAIGWGVGIASTFYSITALEGHDLPLKVGIIVFVTVANVVGTKLGQVIGTRLLESKKVRMLFAKGNVIQPTRDERLAYLESVSHTHPADAVPAKLRE